jgi:predicted membrane-bound spermidine synthase
MMVPPFVLSFLVGFLSLGAETLWVRTYTFANQSTPTALAVVLAIYLLGIARGADIGGRYCRTSDRLNDVAAMSILAASAVVAFSPLLVLLMPQSPTLLVLALFPLIFAPAMLFSICFPICHHLGTKADGPHVGRSLSRVYAANILGSVSGPLFVGFFMLEYVNTQTAFVVLGTAGMVLAGVLAIGHRMRPVIGQASLAGGLLGIGVLSVAAAANATTNGSGNWLMTKLAANRSEVRHVVENRQGIIVAHKEAANDDSIFGGNVYDGRTNIDPRINSNGLNRIIVLAAITPRPKRVLVLGLSIGSWQHILSGFPGVEHMDVIEINPGYLELARNYDAQHAAINDPRAKLFLGDGRKFLRQNPDARYDLVVINTTWHWRMYSSLLLSREFMTLVKAHMTPEAVLAFNTTGSPDALKTATTVFPHAYLYENFTIAGFSDWRGKLSTPAAAEALRAIRPAGKPLFGPNDDDIVNGFLDARLIGDLAGVEQAAGRKVHVITDRNLITEYRYGRR